MPDILSDINRSIIEGATAIFIGGVQASALDASGNVLIEGNTTPPTQTAPVASSTLTRASSTLLASGA